jgi:DNA-binding LacI/PurR family transcriptional regulator
VAQYLRTEILSGRLQVGDQIGSHQELSARFQVSLITVKRALAELIAEGLLYGRAGKGTFVRSSSLRRETSKLRTIGLVLRDLKSPFFSMILQGAESCASLHGYSLLISQSSSRLEKEEEQIRHFREIGASGLIIASMTHQYTTNRHLRELHDSRFPYIVVSYIIDPDIYFVGTDHQEGGYLAGRHLLERGYRRIGYINGEEGNAVGELRKEGLLRAMADAGLRFDERWLYRLRLRGEWHDYASGYEIGSAFTATPDRPDAIFAYNDLSALGFQQAVLDRGWRVPGDVAMIGFDGIERGEYAPVPLTTIRQPVDAIGAKAVEHLLARIEGRSIPVRTILHPQLIVRESCGWGGAGSTEFTSKGARHERTV